jgi:hypothetical protein
MDAIQSDTHSAPVASIRLGTLLELAASKGGVVVKAPTPPLTTTYAPAFVSSRATIILRCSQGHVWTALACHVHEWCTICSLLVSMQRADPGIYTTQTEYKHGQRRFEFVCSHGHRFITSGREYHRGCRTCRVLAVARQRHCPLTPEDLMVDNQCVYAHDGSRLRLHCNRLMHNQQCTSPTCVNLRSVSHACREYDPNCDNIVPCNKDFYATPAQLTRAPSLRCYDNHRWPKYSEIVKTVRAFEIQFDTRFDDRIGPTSARAVEVTGYNATLGIAFTHMADTTPANCAIVDQWCLDAGILFVRFGKELVLSVDIVRRMAQHLHLYNRVTHSPQAIIAAVRTRIHAGNATGHHFVHRCTFGAEPINAEPGSDDDSA